MPLRPSHPRLHAWRAGLAGRAPALIVAATWLVHGGYNKLLEGSARHLAIVQATPGFEGRTGEHVLALIGLGEVAIAMWVISGAAPRTCAAVQTLALLSMNVVELTFARHLLLWPAGLLPVNIVFLTLAWTAALPGWPARLRARLQRHPMAVRAHFSECIALTYSMPAAVLRPLLPAGLELDTREGLGFVAVAMVATQRLRPAALPRLAGRDFFLVGYRIFATFRRPDGRRLRGLYVLRSDTDQAVMAVAGNLLTHYNYHRCDVSYRTTPEHSRVVVRSEDGDADLDITTGGAAPALPDGSPFTSWAEARRYAGPMPFTFDYEPATHSIVAIEATRTTWRPSPVRVHAAHAAFLERPPFAGARPVLAAGFRVRSIDYEWKRGQVYPLARTVAS